MYPQVFGKYVLERELSRGGMARVILATLRGAGGFEKRLVVKQIRDELAYDQVFIRRFVEEAKMTVALSHPNIVPVYELGVEQGTYFLAMELVEGVSVAELLRERNEDGSRRVLTPEEGAYVGVEVCRALDYAHRRMKVVHRDITPRNVMIDEEGQIKLIDFGIAAPALVAGHEILGSPGHMAPEQVDGGELGPPTDIFAVAVLLMEAWTGSAPFRRATPEECSAAMREPHPTPSAFDTRLFSLDAAIARALSIDPAHRQQEASDLARELRAFLQSSDVADIARALGDRVRAFRAEASDASPVARSTDPRPSVASHGDLGTKTFAARDEALRWPTPAESEVEGAVPSTRRIDPPSESGEELPPLGPTPKAAEVKPSIDDDPMLSVPTPLMVDVEELERIHGKLAEAQASSAGAPKASDVPTVRRMKLTAPERDPERDGEPSRRASPSDTLATRPLETPIEVRTQNARAAIRAEREKRIIGGGVIVAALFALGGYFAWRAQHDPRELPQTQITSATPPAPAPIPSVLLPAATGSAPAPPPATTPVASSAAPSASVALAKASVALLGEPGTRVSIDGAPRGACPVRLALEPGSHEIRFVFDPTGESRGERITVKSGEHVTVRAEFTGATPTVKIQR